MEEGKYKIAIEGRWSLEDFYVFPRTYEQVYYLMYSLLPQEDELAVERIERAYSVFPWQGGYSAVNFYNQLKYVFPTKERPYIISIQYASPGWIEIGMLVGVALNIERIVKSISGSIKHANSVYHDIYKGLQERKLLRIKVKREEFQLKKEELEFVKESVGMMSDLLGFNNIAEINERTGSPYRTLKILLSFYRRVRTLVEYEKKGKTKL